MKRLEITRKSSPKNLSRIRNFPFFLIYRSSAKTKIINAKKIPTQLLNIVQCFICGWALELEGWLYETYDNNNKNLKKKKDIVENILDNEIQQTSVQEKKWVITENILVEIALFILVAAFDGVTAFIHRKKSEITVEMQFKCGSGLIINVFNIIFVGVIWLQFNLCRVKW